MNGESTIVGISLCLASLGTLIFAYPYFWKKRHELLPHVPTIGNWQPFFLPVAISRALYVLEIGALSLLALELGLWPASEERELVIKGLVVFHVAWMSLWLAMDEGVQTPQLVFFTLGLLALLQPPEWHLWDAKLTMFFMYLHGGLHKLNHSFFHKWPTFFLPFINRFLDPHFTFTRFLSPATTRKIGALIALMEASLAIPLVFPVPHWLTAAAVVALVMMHASIMVAIGPHVSFSAAGVWPWNICCILCLPALYWPTTFSSLFSSSSAPASSFASESESEGQLKHYVVTLMVVIVAGICPIFAYFGKGYPQLSWLMYSFNSPSPEILVRPPVPLQLQKFEGKNLFWANSINTWLLTSLYHITPILSLSGNQKLAAFLAANYRLDVTLLYTHRPHPWTGYCDVSNLHFPPPPITILSPSS